MSHSAPETTPSPTHSPGSPAELAKRWAQTMGRFLAVEAAGGILLIVATATALILANSPWGEKLAAFWETRVGFTLGSFELLKPLRLWINDGLMTIFFFVVGLEIKREIVLGELGELRKALFPAAAALGGMIVPACIYLALQTGQPGQAGWAVPMATDIAFAVGILSLFGKRIPAGLKLFVLSLAIIDDLGAVLVIAFVFTDTISAPALAAAAGGFALIAILNRAGVRRVPVYVAVGAAIWLLVLKSGVHPTVAGVLLGLLTPASAWVGDRALLELLGDILSKPQDAGAKGSHSAAAHRRRQLEVAARESVSPLERLEVALHPWVSFGIMPLFALANTGVTFQLSAFSGGVTLAVAAGLVLGKPLGIWLCSWLAVKAGVAGLPEGVGWRLIFGAACLCGIGFTMSLFINGLALQGALLEQGKVGTLVGSLVSACLGCIFLAIALRGRGVPGGGAPTTPGQATQR